jgi:hypothetical protein
MMLKPGGLCELDKLVSRWRLEPTMWSGFFEKMMVFEGTVTSWTVPVPASDGFESTVYLETFVLHVVSNTLEEHVWPTRVGQRVWAEDVTYDSPWEGRTASCFLMEEEEKKGVRYKDVPTDKITGFRRDEAALVVFLERKAEVKCVDAENSKLLLDIGVGGLVRLFNVTVSARSGICVTSTSGVRRVEREVIPEAPPSPPRPLGPPEKATKWICITCNYVNYPGASVCRGCDLQRKQGPLKGSAWNFRFDSIPRRQFKRFPQWRCRQCGNRDNYYFAPKRLLCQMRSNEEGEGKVQMKKEKFFQRVLTPSALRLVLGGVAASKEMVFRASFGFRIATCGARGFYCP